MALAPPSSVPQPVKLGYGPGRGDEPLITELRHNNHAGPRLPPVGVPERPLDDILPPHQRRRGALSLPTTSEPEVLRHFGRLARRTFSRSRASTPWAAAP